jgi:hypothetical protein
MLFRDVICCPAGQNAVLNIPKKTGGRNIIPKKLDILHEANRYFSTKTFQMNNSIIRFLIGFSGLLIFFTSDAQLVTHNYIVNSGGTYHSSTQLYQSGSFYLTNGLRTGEQSFIIPSDSTSQSVLISDLMADQSGYQSPIIGTGAWSDVGKDIQAKSLLFFNVKQYAADLKAADIVRVDLILLPVNIEKNDEVIHFPRIAVRRVIQPWEDSATTWKNQPDVSLSDEVSYTLSSLKKTNYYKINITRLFRNMLRFGNYGFQISYPENKETVEPFSRWFASPKSEEPNLRPFLLITIYAQTQNYYTLPPGQQSIMTFNDAIRNMPVNDMYWRNNFKTDVQPAPAAPTPPPPPKKDDN